MRGPINICLSFRYLHLPNEIDERPGPGRGPGKLNWSSAINKTEFCLSPLAMLFALPASPDPPSEHDTHTYALHLIFMQILLLGWCCFCAAPA